MKSDLKIKVLNNEASLWLPLRVKWLGVMGRNQRIGKLWLSSLYTWKEKGGNALAGDVSLSLKYLEKCTPSFLIKRCREIVKPNLDNVQCSFRPGRSTTDQNLTLQQIFEEYGSKAYAKAVYTCLTTSRNHTTRFLVETFAGSSRWTVLMAAFYWQSSHCVHAYTCVSISVELPHNRSLWVLDSNQAVCCHHSSS